jgi:TrmH family RNA methyltransferase
MVTKQQVKYIQSLNEKKFRAQEGLFVAEGPKLISELLTAPEVEPVDLYATKDWWVQHESLKQNLPFVLFHELSEQELGRISFLNTPNQVLGIFKQRVTGNLSLNGITLVLDAIQDPGNLGTILRIADWFGIEEIVASVDSADVYNPKVVQSSMGSLARVKIFYQDLQVLLAGHRHIPVYACTLQGKPLAEAGKLKSGIVLIGNESKGIRKELVDLAHHQLTIPRIGRAESLNAAVATGIVLSHLV